MTVIPVVYRTPLSVVLGAKNEMIKDSRIQELVNKVDCKRGKTDKTATGEC
jgi:hypothetical protein